MIIEGSDLSTGCAESGDVAGKRGRWLRAVEISCNRPRYQTVCVVVACW